MVSAFIITKFTLNVLTNNELERRNGWSIELDVVWINLIVTDKQLRCLIDLKDFTS
jgi:hypothetical protein